jgi:hypothetical protein
MEKSFAQDQCEESEVHGQLHDIADNLAIEEILKFVNDDQKSQCADSLKRA